MGQKYLFLGDATNYRSIYNENPQNATGNKIRWRRKKYAAIKIWQSE
jgi:hypothetical protein